MADPLQIVQAVELDEGAPAAEPAPEPLPWPSQGVELDEAWHAARALEWEVESKRRLEYVLEVRSAGEDGRRAERARCRADPLHWFRTWGVTYDPRAPGDRNDWPFVPYGFQETFLRELFAWLGSPKRRNIGHIGKSRELGATWLVTGAIVWVWLFADPPQDWLVGSKDKKSCDDFTVLSLFGKLRYQLRKQPPWMLPAAWRGPEVSREHDQHMKLVNPETGATIVGAAMGRNFGAGGRVFGCLVDEAALIQYGDSVFRSLTSVARFTLLVSTPRGSGNAFAQYRKRPGVRKWTLHWSQHPHMRCGHEAGTPHVDCWYAQATSQMLTEHIPSELEISYEGSVSGALWPMLSRARHFCEDEFEWRRLESTFPRLWAGVGIDPGIYPSATAIVWCFWHPAERCLYISDYIEGTNTQAKEWADRMVAMATRYHARLGIGPGAWVYYMDPAGWQRDPELRQGFAHWFDAVGIQVWKAQQQSQREPILIFGGMLEGNGGRVLLGPRCEKLYERLANSHWEVPPGAHFDDEGYLHGVSMQALKPSKKGPESHGRDALMNLVMEWCNPRRDIRMGRTQL